ncbi:MAG: LysM peptidoglycan-binding domain-containing protein, partial [Candidatus Omnitrophota bacterium]
MKNKTIIIIIGSVFLLLAILLAVKLRKTATVAETKKEGVSASALLSQAKDLLAKGELLSAREVYQKLIFEFPSSGEIMNWQKKIEDLNIKLIFSPAITAESVLYEIKPGDTLNKIAKEFKTTAELIMKSNNL